VARKGIVGGGHGCGMWWLGEKAEEEDDGCATVGRERGVRAHNGSCHGRALALMGDQSHLSRVLY
jgi:hypothetical protein